MYGLIISNYDNKDNIVKVSFNKSSLDSIALEKMKNFILENKNIPKDDLFLSWLEAVSIKNIELAMEIFTNISLSIDKPMLVSIFPAEIIQDS
jgi:hypothetical protein